MGQGQTQLPMKLSMKSKAVGKEIAVSETYEEFVDDGKADEKQFAFP